MYWSLIIQFLTTRTTVMKLLIFRLRMGHAGVNFYLNRFGMTESELCQNCQVPETILHFLLECDNHRTQREILLGKLRAIGIMNPNLKIILGGDENHKENRGNILASLLEYIISTDMLRVL